MGEKRYFYTVGDSVSGVFSPIAPFVTTPSLCQGAVPPSWPQQRTANWCPQIELLGAEELRPTAAGSPRWYSQAGGLDWHGHPSKQLQEDDPDWPVPGGQRADWGNKASVWSALS